MYKKHVKKINCPFVKFFAAIFVNFCKQIFTIILYIGSKIKKFSKFLNLEVLMLHICCKKMFSGILFCNL